MFNRTRSLVARVLQRSREIRGSDLRSLAAECKARMCEGKYGESLIECYALGVESIRRNHNIEMYPVQLMAALEMRRNTCVEMQTGEGKTYTSVLPIVNLAMQRNGCHVVTANDYLVDRDSSHLTPVYRDLGLSVGAIKGNTDLETRKLEYRKDITYITAPQLGFDFLKDQIDEIESLDSAHRDRIQGKPFAAVVDEADHTLIDEARTPLIIGTPVRHKAGLDTVLQWANETALRINRNDFTADPDRKHATLTKSGCQSVVLSQSRMGATIGTEDAYRSVEVAIQAQQFYSLNKEYLVEDGELVLIDQRTGRQLPGRRWQLGLHQAIEAKEGIPISVENADAARISIQQLFKQYHRLVGMTGTTAGAEKELKQLYRMRTVRITTHRPSLRSQTPTTIWQTRDLKWEFIGKRVLELLSEGRPVLIGTSSVQASEELSDRFLRLGITHEVLNAKQDRLEADVIAHAGSHAAVTIATNMAGRGTDIPLSTASKRAGGLHVIVTELSVSRRVDRQLIGRAARQGDPGSFEFALSLQDDLLRSASAAQKRALVALNLSRPSHVKRAFAVLKRIQSNIEKAHRKARNSLQKSHKNHEERSRRFALNPYVELLAD